MKSIKAIFRRGQNAKIDGQNLPDNLSRTSSITNVDAEQKQGKGAKPRKSASRDRIDKITEGKKNDKKGEFEVVFFFLVDRLMPLFWEIK